MINRRRSKYPCLHRVITEIQEITGNPSLDGFIGPNTEKYLAKCLEGYDGNDVIGYLSDLPHRQVEASATIHSDNDSEVSSSSPEWLETAKLYLGLREIHGSKHNPKILEWWEACGLSNFKTDEIPWCAGFVGGVLVESGYKSTGSGMARSYLKYGKQINTPRPGAIAVFWRGSRNSASGHVAFCTGGYSGNYIPVLGGNQGDEVCIKNYPKSRLLGFRWPIL